MFSSCTCCSLPLGGGNGAWRRWTERQQAGFVFSWNEQASNVEPVEGHADPLVLTKDEVEVLTEMERGRWVVERLQQGGHYNETRNVEKKLHPDRVGWDKLLTP
jgi:hypothetical protein